MNENKRLLTALRRLRDRLPGRWQVSAGSNGGALLVLLAVGLASFLIYWLLLVRPVNLLALFGRGESRLAGGSRHGGGLRGCAAFRLPLRRGRHLR
jgi:hypothetical protein